MRLVDILGGVDLSVYPEIAIVIFMLVFAWATVRILRSPRAEIEHAARLPLDERADEGEAHG